MNENDKQAKPVGQVTSGMQQNGSQCFKPYSDDALPIGAEIYATAQPVQPAVAQEPVIDTCDFGHTFAKLSDHPTKDGQSRCPHCLVIGLDLERSRNISAPAVAVNEQLLEALRRIVECDSEGFPVTTFQQREKIAKDAIRAAEAEKAKGGV